MRGPWLASGSAAWRDDGHGYKTLALEHKLAAKRGNFFQAYSAMELLDKDAATPEQWRNTGPAMVRPLPWPRWMGLAECIEPDGSLNELSTMDVLRQYGALADMPEVSS